MPMPTHSPQEDRFRCGERVRYIGPDAAQPVNRTILAPYGTYADLMSFRRYEGFGHAKKWPNRRICTA